MALSAVELVTASFRYFRTQDRVAAFALYSDDFRFTSPQDDHIDKAAYFQRCFPSASHFRTQRLIRVVDAGDDLILVYYEYELADGGAFANMEAVTVRDGLIREVQVFFGGARPSAPSPS